MGRIYIKRSIYAASGCFGVILIFIATYRQTLFSHPITSLKTNTPALISRRSSLSARLHEKWTSPKSFPRFSPLRQCNDTTIRQPGNKRFCRLLRLQLNDTNRDTFLYLFKNIFNVAEGNDWPYFITFGTLLGSWRHHGLIPWDSDGDIFLPLGVRLEILKAFEGNEDITLSGPYPTHFRHLKMYSKSRSKEPSFHWFRPNLDIYFYEENSTHIWEKDYDVWSMEREVFFPLHRRPFEGMLPKAPRDSLRWIHRWYGATDYCKLLDHGKASCKRLKYMVPFVHREVEGGLMKETLKYGDHVIQEVFVEEMATSVTGPYDLIQSDNQSTIS